MVVSRPKIRDFHKLKILRGEARGYTSVIASKKSYRRTPKHKKPLY